MQRIQIRPLTRTVNLLLNIAALGLREMEGARGGAWEVEGSTSSGATRTKKEIRNNKEKGNMKRIWK